MSNKFELVKNYYDKRIWNISMVRNAVVKMWINKEEYKQITGQIYS